MRQRNTSCDNTSCDTYEVGCIQELCDIFDFLCMIEDLF